MRQNSVIAQLFTKWFAQFLVVLMATTMVLEQVSRMDPSNLVEIMDTSEKEKQGEEKEQKDQVEKDKFFNEDGNALALRTDVQMNSNSAHHVLSDGHVAIISPPPDQV